MATKAEKDGKTASEAAATPTSSRGKSSSSSSSSDSSKSSKFPDWTPLADKEKYSAGMAYVWLFLTGLMGGHHIYLGRTFHAMAWMQTMGFGGIGLLRDFVNIPRYVAEANNDPGHVALFKAKYRCYNGHPKATFERMLLQAAMGVFYLLMARAFGGNAPPLRIACGALGAALGVWVAGNIGDQTGSFKSAIYGAATGAALSIFNGGTEASIWLVLGSMINFNRTLKYKRVHDKPVAKRCGGCGRVGLLVIVQIVFLVVVVMTLPGMVNIKTSSTSHYDNFSSRGGWSRAWNDLMSNLHAEEDPYDVLGLQSDASWSDVKRAYHTLAKEYHPDKNPDNPEAATKFMRVQQAYEKLLKEHKGGSSGSGGGAGGDPSAGADGSEQDDIMRARRARQQAEAEERLRRTNAGARAQPKAKKTRTKTTGSKRAKAKRRARTDL